MAQNRIDMIREMLVKIPHDPFLNYALALELEKTNEMEEAIAIIEQILEREPNYLGAYYKLGKLYEEQGRHEKAIDVYKKGMEVAQLRNDQKTIGELSEALMMLVDED